MFIKLYKMILPEILTCDHSNIITQQYIPLVLFITLYNRCSTACSTANLKMSRGLTLAVRCQVCRLRFPFQREEVCLEVSDFLQSFWQLNHQKLAFKAPITFPFYLNDFTSVFFGLHNKISDIFQPVIQVVRVE